MKEALISLFLILGFFYLSIAQTPPTGQIERSQEILQKEGIFKDKIEKQEKIYIKRIIVKGATLLDQEQIREIILPFQRHWLTKDDIRHLVDSLKQSYQQQSREVPVISYVVEGGKLIIEVKQEKP